MKFKLSVVACAILTLGSLSVSAATTSSVKKNSASEKTAKSSAQKNNNPFIKMVRNLSGIQYKDAKVSEVKLQFGDFLTNWSDVFLRRLTINSKQHYVNGTFGEIKLSFLGKSNSKDNKVSKSFYKAFPIVIKDVKHYNDFDKKDGLWFGSGQSKAATFELANNVELYGVQVAVRGRDRGDRAQYSLRYNIKEVKSKKYEAGPMAANLSLNVDKKALSNFVKINRQLHSGWKDFSNLSTTQKDKLKQQGNDAFFAMIKEGVKFNINNISYNKGDDKLKINGYINIPKYEGDKLSAKNAGKAIMHNATMKLNISISKQLLMDSAKTIAMNKSHGHRHSESQIKGSMAMVQGFVGMAQSQGYLVQRGDNYISKIVLRDGVLTINGKKVNMHKKMSHREHTASGKRNTSSKK